MLKKSVIINAGKIKPIKIKTDYKTIVLFTMFLCGVIIGVSFTIKFSNDYAGYIDSIFNEIVTFNGESSFLENFASTFTFYSVFFVFLFISGMCGVGLPLQVLTLVIFGGFCGFNVSSYILSNGLQGLAICALVNIPAYAIIAATLVKCCSESFDMSVKIFSYILGNIKDKSKEISLKDYILKYLVFSVPVIVASVLKVAIFQLVQTLFDFF